MNASATVLIVDDQEAARVAVQMLLRRDGHRLELASSGVEALACLRRLPIDLVLCDVVMPGMDGFGLCAAIKSHTDWRDIPTVLLTGLDGDDYVARGLAAGADDFLVKPVDKVLLRERVQELLHVRALDREAGAGGRNVEVTRRARRERKMAERGLTRDERELVDLLLLGRTPAEIGLARGITAHAALREQEDVLRKLGASSRVELRRLFL